MVQRTQLQDLQAQLKDAEYNIKYCEWKGIQGSPLHKGFVDRALEIRSIINNIR